MSLKLKPVTRLSVIFILLILLSGSVLTYFSINNISNLKELTEKKIIEEQRGLFAGFTAALQYKLDTITAGLGNTGDPPAVIKDSLLKRALEFECVIQPFMLNGEGQFLYPRFEGIPEEVKMPVFSEKYRTSYIEGEQAEFAQKDFGQAEKLYLSCLRNSTGSSDSVKALNALGRVAVKLDDKRNALSRYSIIATDLYSESDENGYPYVYYALPQLLKIPMADIRDELVPVFEFVLRQIKTGSIPLNYSTGELPGLLREWLNDNNIAESDELPNLNGLIESLDQQLQLVNKYGDELKEIADERSLSDNYVTDNDFKIVTSRSGDNHEFFLVSADPDLPAGFLIDRNKMFDTLVTADLQKGFDFDYVIDFPENYIMNNSQSLLFSSQLNPFFPGQLIRIRLMDVDLINDIVKRRSWIYGIASLLLLVAMVLGVVLILRDISREKHLARLRADFISNVTHELKTPLTSIRMYAESLIMGRVKPEEKRKEYLEVVVHESDRLKGMINNILEFSKMEKQSPDYNFVTANLAYIINEALAEMGHWFSQEGFEITSVLEENISADVDPEKMKQALNNLFSNAIKYSTDTKHVFIRLFRKEDNIIIEVEDCGIGMPENELPKIFEPFYRIGQEEGASGTGLGLTVVKEIIEAHGGRITVTSKTGEGSKFVITLNHQPA